MIHTLFSFGNLKQDTSTAIFNMTPSLNCPSQELGLCQVAKHCYAKYPERAFPAVRGHRSHQARFWDMCTPELFVYELNKFEYQKLRISESGDFRHQGDVEKLKAIARLLDKPVWTYTARRDLNFTGLPANLTISGSGFMLDNQFNAVKDPDQFDGVVCPLNCRNCTYCVEKKGRQIYCKIH
ncbi:MAG: hypothetical protein WC699_16010 [Bacteroidales bacterium]|jgi:hypothetical protein